MTEPKRLVLDANILIRAIFGIRVRRLLETYEDSVAFYTPDICFSDAHRYIPAIARKRAIDPAPGIALLELLSGLVQIVEPSLYREHEMSARERLAARDIEDWPIVATALLLQCPVWTEDQDFFGSGIPTWTSNTIEIYLRSA